MNKNFLVSSLLASLTSCSPALADTAFDMSFLQRAVPAKRMALPVVSTGSVDFNSVDMPFIRSAGGSGAFPSGAGSGSPSGSSASGSQIPALPPGYAAVMCHGIYAGAIPPGGNVSDFWAGAYGFAGDAQQQEALRQEGIWLRENGQLD